MTEEDKNTLKDIFLRTLKARIDGLYEDVANLKQELIGDEVAASQVDGD